MSSLIALTGATGFIGQRICRVLHAAGFQVRVLARSQQRVAPVSEYIDDVVQGDVHDAHALQALVTDANVVVHCAGVVRGASQEEFNRVNVDGVGNLLDAMQASAGSARLFYLSSLAAREPDLSFYARSKWLSEQLLMERAGDRSWLALRPPAVYGPGDRELLPLFKVMAKGIAPVLGTDDARFSMIYVDDIAQLVLAWIQQNVTVSGVFALHDGRPGGYSWQDVCETVADLCQRRVRMLRVPRPLLDVPAGVNRSMARLFGYAPMLTPEKLRELRHPDWVCDNGALSSVVDWQPAVRLPQGLRATPGWCAALD